MISFNHSQHGRFAQSGGWVWDLPWLEDGHVCSQEVERPPRKSTKLHPLHWEPHWSSQYVWHKITNKKNAESYCKHFPWRPQNHSNAWYPLDDIVSHLRNSLFQYRWLWLLQFCQSFNLYLYFCLSLFSKVGWCWKVQRVHDPDVLKAKLYLTLMEAQCGMMWHLFIS